MRQLLRAAGAPDEVLKDIDEIVESCRACRTWTRPSPNAATTSRSIEAFNEVVQHDLLFISLQPGKKAHTKNDPRANPWQHLICVCTRLSQAARVRQKTTEELCKHIEYMWTRPYGPPALIESDQEYGLVSEEAKLFLQRAGTELKDRGVNAHTRMLESHHGVLRTMFLRLVSQAAEEGITVTEDHLITLALTAKNALFTVGGATPTQAVFGRQPAILPSIDTSPAGCEDETGSMDGHSRGRHRLRELAVQAMVEATARHRIQRALRTKTRPAVQREEYKPDDDVEFWREPAQKEMQGWRGPGRVVHVEADGTIHVRWQGGTVVCRSQDVRRALMLLSFTFLQLAAGTTHRAPPTPYEHLTYHVNNMTVGTTVIFAVLHNKLLTQAARQDLTTLQAILHVASCGLHLSGCVGARLGRGPQRLEALSYDDSLIWWWLYHKPSQSRYIRTPATRSLDIRLLHPERHQICIVQFLFTNTTDIEELRDAHPDLPHLGGSDWSDSGSVVSQTDPGPLLDPDRKRPRSRTSSGNPGAHINRCLPSAQGQKHPRSEASDGSGNPAAHVSRRLPSSPSSSISSLPSTSTASFGTAARSRVSNHPVTVPDPKRTAGPPAGRPLTSQPPAEPPPPRLRRTTTMSLMILRLIRKILLI